MTLYLSALSAFPLTPSFLRPANSAEALTTNLVVLTGVALRSEPVLLPQAMQRLTKTLGRASMRHVAFTYSGVQSLWLCRIVGDETLQTRR